MIVDEEYYGDKWQISQFTGKNEVRIYKNQKPYKTIGGVKAGLSATDLLRILHLYQLEDKED